MTDRDKPIFPLLDQARYLSSGTIASLTGLSKYSEVDPIRIDFYEFCEENQARFDCWQPAWREYAKLKGFITK